MQTLLTKARIAAFSNQNRWNGWTSRPFSALEHSLIGFKVLRDFGAPREVQRGFLLHDVHETEFCEIITPVKEAFVTPDYFAAVRGWDDMLCNEIGEAPGIMASMDVTVMDLAMRDAEAQTIANAPWKPQPGNDQPELIERAVIEIKDSMFSTPSAQRAFFWDAMEMTNA